MSIGFSVCHTSGEKLRIAAQPKNATREEELAGDEEPAGLAPQRGAHAGTPPEEAPKDDEHSDGRRADGRPVGNSVEAREQPDRISDEDEPERSSEHEPPSREAREEESREGHGSQADELGQEPEEDRVDQRLPRPARGVEGVWVASILIR